MRSFFYKYAAFAVMLICSMGFATAQSGSLDANKTTDMEVASNISLDISAGTKKGFFNVQINNQNTGASCIGGELSVYNMAEEKLYSTFANTSLVSLDLTKFKSGTYIVQFIFENKQVKKELVIK
jgi:hypothetical protein